jgi:hypothetical protein
MSQFLFCIFMPVTPNEPVEKADQAAAARIYILQ